MLMGVWKMAWARLGISFSYFYGPLATSFGLEWCCIWMDFNSKVSVLLKMGFFFNSGPIDGTQGIWIFFCSLREVWVNMWMSHMWNFFSFDCPNWPSNGLLPMNFQIWVFGLPRETWVAILSWCWMLWKALGLAWVSKAWEADWAHLGPEETSTQPIK